MDNLTIFTGTANPDLCVQISRALGLRAGSLTIRNFADQEIFVQIRESVRGKDVFIIQPTSKPGHYHLLELLIIVDALKRASADRITAVIPYFGYARQDRKDQPRVAITAKLIANLLTVAGVNRILAMDLHAAQIMGFFDIPVDHLSAVTVFVEHLRKTRPKDETVIVSPDTGGVVRARRVAQMLDANLAIIDKRRPGHNKAEGLDLVIIDDMIDTAGTLSEASRALMEKGARSVIACATHGVLSGEAYDNINASPLKKVIITDTIAVDRTRSDKIEVLSVAPLFAAAIEKIHKGESVGELFKE
jgi:ribose-phosphate pyrophosphokinase